MPSIMPSYLHVPALILLLNGIHTTGAFQSFNLPKMQLPQIFQPRTGTNTNTRTPSRPQQESIILETISNTQNGKSATIPQQREILNLVSALETKYPSPPLKEILSSGKIGGTWFLQFTSPSEIKDDDSESELESGSGSEASTWKVENAEENITTQKYNAKGSVSAAGINVDVSKKPPKQIFDLSQNAVFNEVTLDNAFVRVGGPFRLSDKNERRALVAFKECKINLKIGIKLDLGFLFDVRAFLRGTDESGWLETTYLSDKMRIGRGNKGSMFILTRDEDAVVP